jgi:hypothetical protein
MTADPINQWPIAYRKEVSPGLVVEIDESDCIVLRSDRPTHTITNVERFKEILDIARTYQRINDEGRAL